MTTEPAPAATRFSCVACGEPLAGTPGGEAVECPKCFAQNPVPEAAETAPTRTVAGEAPPAPGSTATLREIRFPCVACGASLAYLPGTEVMECTKCFAENPIPVDRRAPVERPLETLGAFLAGAPRGFGASRLAFRCDACGATCSFPSKRLATRCSFCAAPAVIPAVEDPAMIRPESLVPFAFDTKAARERIDAWIGTLWLRPGNLGALAGAGTLRGIYLPYYTYDARARSTWRGERGTHYYTTERYTVRRRGRTERRTRRVRHTRWGDWRSGEHLGAYDDQLFCASHGLSRMLLEEIEPFKLGGLVAYRHQFLAGFEAEIATRSPMEGWAETEERLRATEHDACDEQLDGDTHRNLEVNTQFYDVRCKHLLLPVYIASYRHRETLYRIMVNGQTGEPYGEAPASAAKVSGALATGPAAGMLLWLAQAPPLAALVAGIGLFAAAAITVSMMLRSAAPASAGRGAEDDTDRGEAGDDGDGAAEEAAAGEPAATADAGPGA